MKSIGVFFIEVLRFFFEKDGRFNWVAIGSIAVIVSGGWAVYTLNNDNSNLSKDRMNEHLVKYELDTLTEFKKASADFGEASVNFSSTLIKFKLDPKDVENNKLNDQNRDSFRKARQRIVTSINPDNTFSDEIMEDLGKIQEQVLVGGNGKNVTYTFEDEIYLNYIKEEKKIIQNKIQ